MIDRGGSQKKKDTLFGKVKKVLTTPSKRAEDARKQYESAGDKGRDALIVKNTLKRGTEDIKRQPFNVVTEVLQNNRGTNRPSIITTAKPFDVQARYGRNAFQRGLAETLNRNNELPIIERKENEDRNYSYQKSYFVTGSQYGGVAPQVEETLDTFKPVTMVEQAQSAAIRDTTKDATLRDFHARHTIDQNLHDNIIGWGELTLSDQEAVTDWILAGGSAEGQERRIKRFKEYMKDSLHDVPAYDPDTGVYSTAQQIRLDAKLPPWIVPNNTNLDWWDYYKTYSHNVVQSAADSFREARDEGRARARNPYKSAFSTSEEKGAVNSFLDVVINGIDTSSLSMTYENIVRGTARYLNEYTINPIKEGHLLTAAGNAVYNLMETMDVASRAVRAFTAGDTVLGGSGELEYVRDNGYNRTGTRFLEGDLYRVHHRYYKKNNDSKFKGQKVYWARIPGHINSDHEPDEASKRAQERFMQNGGQQLLMLDNPNYANKEMLGEFGGVTREDLIRQLDAAFVDSDIAWRDIYTNINEYYFTDNRAVEDIKQGVENIKKAYTDVDADYAADTGNLAADMIVETVLDPGLIAGGIAKGYLSHTKGVVREASEEAVRNGFRAILRNTDEATELSKNTDVQRAIASFIASNDSKNIIFKDAKALDDDIELLTLKLQEDVPRLVESADARQLFKDRIAYDLLQVSDHKNSLIMSSLPRSREIINTKAFKAVSAFDRSVDAIDSAIIKSSFFVPWASVKGAKAGFKTVMDTETAARVMAKMQLKKNAAAWSVISDKTGKIDVTKTEEVFKLQKQGAINETAVRTAMTSLIDEYDQVAFDINNVINKFVRGSISDADALQEVGRVISDITGGSYKSVEELSGYVDNLAVKYAGDIQSAYKRVDDVYKRLQDAIDYTAQGKIDEFKNLDRGDIYKGIDAVGKASSSSVHRVVTFEQFDQILKDVGIDWEVASVPSEISGIKVDPATKKLASFMEAWSKQDYVTYPIQDALRFIDRFERQCHFRVLLNANTPSEASALAAHQMVGQLNSVRKQLKKIDVISLRDVKVVTLLHTDRVALLDEFKHNKDIETLYGEFYDEVIAPIVKAFRGKTTDEVSLMSSTLFKEVDDIARQKYGFDRTNQLVDQIKHLPDFTEDQLHSAVSSLGSMFNSRNGLEDLMLYPGQVRNKLTASLRYQTGESQVGKKGIADMLQSVDSDSPNSFLQRYFKEFEDNPDLRKVYDKYAFKDELDPAAAVEQQMLFTVLRDPSVIDEWNELARQGQAFTFHINTTGLNSEINDMTSVAFRKWVPLDVTEENPLTLERLLNAFESEDTIVFQRGMTDSELENSLSENVLRRLGMKDITKSGMLDQYKKYYGVTDERPHLTEQELVEQVCNFLRQNTNVATAENGLEFVPPALIAHDMDGFNISYFTDKVNAFRGVSDTTSSTAFYADSISGLVNEKARNTYKRLADMVGETAYTDEQIDFLTRLIEDYVDDINYYAHGYRFDDMRSYSSQLNSLIKRLELSKEAGEITELEERLLQTYENLNGEVLLENYNTAVRDVTALTIEPRSWAFAAQNEENLLVKSALKATGRSTVNIDTRIYVDDVLSYFDLDTEDGFLVNVEDLQKMYNMSKYIRRTRDKQIALGAEEFLIPYKAEFDRIIQSCKDIAAEHSWDSTQLAYIEHMRIPDNAVDSYLMAKKLYEDHLKFWLDTDELTSLRMKGRDLDALKEELQSKSYVTYKKLGSIKDDELYATESWRDIDDYSSPKAQKTVKRIIKNVLEDRFVKNEFIKKYGKSGHDLNNPEVVKAIIEEYFDHDLATGAELKADYELQKNIIFDQACDYVNNHRRRLFDELTGGGFDITKFESIDEVSEEFAEKSSALWEGVSDASSQMWDDYREFNAAIREEYAERYNKLNDQHIALNDAIREEYAERFDELNDQYKQFQMDRDYSKYFYDRVDEKREQYRKMKAANEALYKELLEAFDDSDPRWADWELRNDDMKEFLEEIQEEWKHAHDNYAEYKKEWFGVDAKDASSSDKKGTFKIKKGKSKELAAERSKAFEETYKFRKSESKKIAAEKAKALEGKLHPGWGRKTTQRQIKKAVRNVLDNTSFSASERREIVDRLDSICKEASRLMEEGKHGEAGRLIYSAVSDVVYSMQRIDSEAFELSKDFRHYLRTTAIATDSVKYDITDFSHFRKSHFGHYKLNKQGTGYDQVLQEMTQLFPDYASKIDPESGPSGFFESIDKILNGSKPKLYTIPEDEQEYLIDKLVNELTDILVERPGYSVSDIDDNFTEVYNRYVYELKRPTDYEGVKLLADTEYAKAKEAYELMCIESKNKVYQNLEEIEFNLNTSDGVFELLEGAHEPEIYKWAARSDYEKRILRTRDGILRDGLDKATKYAEVNSEITSNLRQLRSMDDYYTAAGFDKKSDRMLALTHTKAKQLFDILDQSGFLKRESFQTFIAKASEAHRLKLQRYRYESLLVDGTINREKLLSELVYNGFNMSVFNSHNYSVKEMKDLREAVEGWIAKGDDFLSYYEDRSTGNIFVYLNDKCTIAEQNDFRYINDTLRFTKPQHDVIPYAEFEELKELLDLDDIDDFRGVYHHLLSCWEDIRLLSYGSINGTTGRTVSLRQAEEFMVFLPSNINDWKTAEGLLKHELARDVVYDPGFVINDESDMLVDFLGTLHRQADAAKDDCVLINEVFHNNGLQFNDLVQSFTNDQLIAYFGNNPDYVVCTLVKNNNTATGLEVRRLNLNNEASVQAAKQMQNTAILPYNMFYEIASNMNRSVDDSVYKRLLGKYMLAYKAFALVKPGTWMRNYIDATLKASFDNGEGASNIFTLLNYENKAIKDIGTYGRLLADPSLLKEANWDMIQRVFNTDMTYEEFELLKGVMDGNRFKSADKYFIGKTASRRKDMNIISGENIGLRNLEEKDIKKAYKQFLSKEADLPLKEKEFMDIYFKRIVPTDIENEQYETMFRKLSNKMRHSDAVTLFDKTIDTMFKPFGYVESMVRYAQTMYLHDMGFSQNQTLRHIHATQFYNAPSWGMWNKLENIVPFITFKYNNIMYWIKMMEENPRYFRYFEDIYGEVMNTSIEDALEEGQEMDYEYDYGLQSGGIPLGSAQHYFNVGNSFLSAMNDFYGLGHDFDSLNPLLREAVRGSFYALGLNSNKFFSTVDLNVSDEKPEEKLLKAIPGYSLGKNAVRLFKNLENISSENGGPTMDSIYATLNFLGVLGIRRNYDKSGRFDMELYQQELAEQGMWYDYNQGKIVPISEKNEFGANSPENSFEDVQAYMMVHFGKRWDANQHKFVAFDEYQAGGYNLGFDFDHDPEAWNKLCAYMRKYGKVWDYNQRAFVLTSEYISGGLNDPDLSWDEKIRLMEEKFPNLKWDANQNTFVELWNYIPGGLNDFQNLQGNDFLRHWNELQSLRLALYGETYDKVSHSFIKTTEPSIVLLDSFNGDQRDKYDNYFSMLGIPRLNIVDQDIHISSEGLLMTKDGKYVITGNVEHDQKVFDKFRNTITYGGRGYSRFKRHSYNKNYKGFKKSYSGPVRGPRFKAYHKNLYTPTSYLTGHGWNEEYGYYREAFRFAFQYHSPQPASKLNRLITPPIFYPYGGGYGKFSFHTR